MTPLKLLLVEDSPADAFLVREAIKAEGIPFELEIADDGELAIQMLSRMEAQDGAPALNLMLLDLNLPRRDGIFVLEQLRKNKRCCNVPVIMLSSSDSPRDRQRAFELGASEYFPKPSTLEQFMELGKLIRRLCEQELEACS